MKNIDLGRIVTIAALSLSTAISPTNIDAFHAKDCKSDAERVYQNIKIKEDKPTQNTYPIFYFGTVDKPPYHETDYMKCFVEELKRVSNGRYKAAVKETDKSWIYTIIVEQGTKL